jgi:uncharacterized protein YndB with AHSA1/START domain
MSATEFHLVTDWTLPAPLDAVWAELTKPEEWPSWWRAVERVELLEKGDADGIGALRRLTWRTALPYSLTFDMRTTRVEPKALIEGRAQGELTGVGRWTLAPTGGETQVRYDWRVEVTQPWMRFVAPIARPVFAWNHGVVMGWGREGLVRRLNGRP